MYYIGYLDIMLRHILLLCAVILPGCWTQDDVHAEVFVAIDISQSRAHIGDHVTLVCRIVDMPPDGFIYWFKTVMADDHEYVDLIAASSQPLPPYDVISRMKFASVSSGSSKTFTLTIEGVTEEDTGHYGCSYREMSDNIYETEIFDVYSQVDNITLYVNGTEIGNDVLVVTDGEPVELQIWAGYSVPAPVVMVYIDDVEITRQFSYDTTTHVRCEGGGAGKTCPLYYVRSTKALGSYAFNAHQHGSNLIIKTQVTGSGFPNLNRSIQLMVNHAPVFKCYTQHFVRRSQNYTVTCSVRAVPAATLLYWRLFRDGKVTYAWSGDFLDDWKAIASYEEEETSVCAVSLKLFNLTDFHYTTYELVAGNDIGNSSLNITLFEDFTPTSGPNAAGFLAANVIMTFLTGVLVAILRSSE